jgi:putative ABC transport system ATP-binding protein
MTGLRTKDLVLEYRMAEVTVRAVDGVSLEVPLGEFVAIMGPSGAGKSSFLHLLGGLDQPTSGDVWIHGAQLTGRSEEDGARFRRETIGFIFQFFNLIPTLAAWENVAVSGLLAGTAPKRLRARAVELLDQVGLGARADHRPSQLSGGQQQRVAIARALFADPPVLLADEPTGNLDSASSAEIMALLRSLRDEYRCIVMVTHDPRVAADADRLIRMVDGRVDADGVARDLLVDVRDGVRAPSR